MTREIIRFVFKDRVALTLVLSLLATLVLVSVLLFFWIRPSDIQIPIRYSGYDNSLYNDRWYERLSFLLFLILQTGTSIYIALILHARGYRLLAYFLLLISGFLSILTAIIAFAVTRTVTL